MTTSAVRRFAGAAAFLLLASACGSTVQLDQQVQAGLAPAAVGSEGAAVAGTALDGAATGMTTGAADPGTTTGGGSAAPMTGTGTTSSGGPAPAAGSSTAAGGGSPGTAPAGGQGTSSGGGSPASGGSSAVGPGVTADDINVGLFYVSDGDQANEATGFESNSADARVVYDAILEDVNRQGGVLGRTLKGVYYRGSAVTSQTISEQAQAACSYWHEDNEVFGVLGFPHPISLECTQNAGGVSVHAGLGIFPTETFQQYPEFVEVNGMDVDQQTAVTLGGLRAQGYFKTDLPTGAKVGILTFDTEGFHRAVDETARPALARYGLGEPVVQYIKPPQRASEVGGSSSEVQSAVLRFKSENVSHVIILEGSAGIAGGGHLMFLFTNSAEPQGYRPRYGVNSGVGLNAVSPQTPQGQLDNARAVGWVDPYDMPENRRMNNATVQRCRGIMKRKGLPASGAAFADTLMKCDQVFFFAAAVERGRTPSQSGFIAGTNATGTSYTSGVALATRLASDQHDGAALVRNAKYVASCRCFHPTSEPYRP